MYPGEVDDVLDSVCVVLYSGDGHRHAPIMVSQEELLMILTPMPDWLAVKSIDPFISLLDIFS